MYTSFISGLSALVLAHSMFHFPFAMFSQKVKVLSEGTVSHVLAQISYEMTTSVIFCLSYDLSKELFIAFKVENISTKNAFLSRTSL